jgi:hypothetical protein
MQIIRALLLLFLIALGAATARAADVAYPPGSRIGLAPPPGMVASPNFFGYVDPDNNAAIILSALPHEAYADLDRSVGAEALKRQGLTLESRETVALSTGDAFLVIGHQDLELTKIRKWILVASSPSLTALVTVQIPDAAKTAYPDNVIRAALSSVTVRDAVPIEEQLGLLPFKVTELAGFGIAGIMPGRAVMLVDAMNGTPVAAPPAIGPHMLITVGPGGPPQTAERDAFARDVFGTVPNLRDVRITSSETLRLSGQTGHQILAEAKDPTGSTALTVMQWLRFGGGVYVQMIAAARTEAWKDAYPRFRAVRDGIEPR